MPVPFSRFTIVFVLTPLASAIAGVCPAPPPQGWTCAIGSKDRWSCQGRFAQTELTSEPSQLSRDLEPIHLEGDVSLRRADQSLLAQSLDYDGETQRGKATGPLQYDDRAFRAYAKSATADLAKDSTELFDVRYAFKNGRGQGKARHAVQNPDQTTTLKGVSFTSCSEEHPAWRLTASQMKLDHEKGVGYARDLKLKLGDVPVFYFPVASFPLDERRKSGFLSPIFALNNNGLDLALPYYLNLAPNYDATITPRLIARRGLMLRGEQRFLTSSQNGVFDFSYLSNDRKTQKPRFDLNLEHRYDIDQHWFWAASLHRTSDDFYFDDFGDSLQGAAVSLVPNIAGVYGRGRGWDAGVMADRYEVIDPLNPTSLDPYRRVPRVFANGAQSLGAFDLSLNADWTRFDRDAGVTGNRLDITPAVAFPLIRPAYFLIPKLAWRSTAYDIDGRQGTIRRNLPIFSVDAGLFFDRTLQWGSRNLRQSLEPRLFYLQVPYRNQDALPLFDSSELEFSFAQLFRTNTFIGADRQNNARQITGAVTTRLWDDALGKELGYLAVGQVRYLETPSVSLLTSTPPVLQRSAFVSELGLRFGERWSGTLANQWNPNTDAVDLSSVRLQYQWNDRQLANFGYRYRRDRFEQVDLATIWPVNERWSAIARVNYSLIADKTLEGLAGFEYNNCCYAVRVIGRHFLRPSGVKSRNALYFELELKGLGTLGRKTQELLQRSIIGYQLRN
jgi:LPS-assembly protein